MQRFARDSTLAAWLYTRYPVYKLPDIVISRVPPTCAQLHSVYNASALRRRIMNAILL